MSDLLPNTDHILIVEDSPGARKLAVAMLSALGYTVSAVADGDAAAILLAQAQFALLFTDISLSGTISGLQLAKLAQAQYPAMKILLTSGYPPEAVEIEQVNAYYVGKPYRKVELAAIVRDILTRESTL